jgi:hypothetical protein
MYQIVLTEGSTADVVAFVNRDLLLSVWDELWLSRAVHEAWDSWVQAHREGCRSCQEAAGGRFVTGTRCDASHSVI